MPLRSVDTGASLLGLADEVWVRCRRCDHPGVVSAQLQGYRWVAGRFTCSRCALRLTADENGWQGPVSAQGRQRCGHCGHKWLHAQRQLPRMPERTPAKVLVCAACRRESTLQLHQVWQVDRNLGIDPHLGMQLWLVQPLRLGVLWAYNARHLQALRAYVDAPLRERGAQAGNRSMYSRLPLWMKRAGHRAEIGRALAKLEAKLLEGAQRRGTDRAEP